MGKTKEFRDPVHGYISVPIEYCDAFIDSPIFQRLRHIEQTSMRPLYPSARHDRFVHSLGVYHLAKTAFAAIKANTSADSLRGVDLAVYEPAFCTAALMHDCAHSVFSHTFEAYYDQGGRAKEFLFSLVDASFQGDYEKWFELKGKGPAEHEVFSAAVFLEHYRDRFKELAPDLDAQLIARMVTGCCHLAPSNESEQVENCLIRLINGSAIDVDKLDYILRDTWASGVNNVSIDVDRLLSALELFPVDGRIELVFGKSALSVIKSVLDGRNFLYRWVYSHHTVCYYSKLLQSAVAALDEVLAQAGHDGFLHTVFSREVFKTPVPLGELKIFLPCDYDIYSLLKSYRDQISEVDELLYRQPTRLPLWKTQAEFELNFQNRTSIERAYVQGEVGAILQPVLGEDAGEGKTLVVSMAPKVLDIEEGDVLVKLGDMVRSFRDLTEKWLDVMPEPRNVSFFYVYIPRECADKMEECIEVLCQAKA